MLNIQEDKSLRGAVYSAYNGGMYYPSSDGLFHDVVWASGSVDAILTGYYVQTPGGNVYMQATGGYWVLKGDPDWSEQNMRYTVATYNVSAAQNVVNTIVENNKHILANNLLCARYSGKLTASQRQMLYALQTRLQLRNEALLNDGLVERIETGYPDGYAELSGYLKKFMDNNGVSGVGVIISTTALIVVGCVVIGALATAAYYAYKAYAEESRQDVKFSDELTATLASKLTDEEYEQLLDETEGIVTRARIKSSLSTGTTTIGILLVGLGILTVVNLWKGGTLR